MKNKIKYLLLLMLLNFGMSAQQLQLSLSKGKTCLFNGQVFCFGLVQKNERTALCIYKLNRMLALKDSMTISLGKTSIAGYLDISADTLHNYLNIYLQEKDTKTVTVLRFNKKF